MKKIFVAFLLAVSAAGLIYGFSLKSEKKEFTEDQKFDIPDIKDWPGASQRAARDMEAKYGKPNGVTPDMLIWNNNGTWLKTVVYKKEMKHNFPKPHTDVIEHWINYKVPADKYDELAQYDGSVTANRTNGTISARCDSEAMNFLALNLSHDLIRGIKNIEQARIEYGTNVMAFMKNEKPAYTQKLTFSMDKSAPDPDKALEMMNEMMPKEGSLVK